MTMTINQEMTKFIYENSNNILNKPKRDLYEIAFIIQRNTMDLKTGIPEPHYFTITFKNIKTGYIHPSVVMSLYSVQNKHLYNYVKNKLEENSDKFDCCECYITTKDTLDCRHKLYIPKDNIIEIQNKCRMQYEIFEIGSSDLEGRKTKPVNMHLQEFFSFTFRNFSSYPFRLLTTDDISFFSKFNIDIRLPLLKHAELVQKIQHDNEVRLKKLEADVSSLMKDIISSKSVIADLEKMYSNAENVTEKIYTVISKEEVSSQLLLQQLKKM